MSLTNESPSLVLVPQLADSAARRLHYLGPSKRSMLEYGDEFGFVTFGNPTSRRLPVDWLELNRWILHGQKNGGSRQWGRIKRWVRGIAPDATTVISYSDPDQGHTGALYRACGFIWAPTWHRLVPPPTGNGTRSGKAHSVKDRWIFPLRRDLRREKLLVLSASYERRFPGSSYREPKWHGRKWTLDARTHGA